IRNPRVSAGVSVREHWYTIVTVINTFNNGRVNGFPESFPLWTFLIGGVAFTLPLLFGLRSLLAKSDERERENTLFTLALCWLPIVLALIVGALLSFYAFRYVIFCAAPYYGLVE